MWNRFPLGVKTHMSIGFPVTCRDVLAGFKHHGWVELNIDRSFPTLTSHRVWGQLISHQRIERLKWESCWNYSVPRGSDLHEAVRGWEARVTCSESKCPENFCLLLRFCLHSYPVSSPLSWPVWTASADFLAFFWRLVGFNQQGTGGRE